MQKVFLASDESMAIDSFRAVFGKQLIVLPRNRMQADNQYDLRHPNPMYERRNQYDTALSYLTEEVPLTDYDYVVTMQSISPALQVKSLDDALERCMNEGWDTMISVTNRSRFY